MNSSHNIIIADDHEIVRQGIKFTLENQMNFHISSEASSYSQLRDILEQNSCDVLILDLNLGDNIGIDTINELSIMYPDMKILVLSMYPEDPYALQSIKAGAKGYVSKASISDELSKALGKIINGGIYIKDELLDNLPLDVKLDEQLPTNLIETLSDREYEVFSLLSEGLAYKDIAKKLELSPKTISTYRSRILEKLSLSNTNQLIQYALANKLGKI
jgi:DNA-binding NarL/FixJ family response regulator